MFAGYMTFKHRRGCDGGVDGVAALLQDAQAGLRRERLHGRHDAVARHDLGSRLRKPSFGSIAADRLAGGRRCHLGADTRQRRLCNDETRPNDEDTEREPAGCSCAPVS